MAETEGSAETFSKAVNELRSEVELQVGEEVGGREEQRDSEDSAWVGAGGVVALEVVSVLWDTGTGRGRTMLSSAVEISPSQLSCSEFYRNSQILLLSRLGITTHGRKCELSFNMTHDCS